MFEIDNEVYDIVFDMKRVKTLESIAKMGVVDILQSTPSLTNTQYLLGASLVHSTNGDISLKRALELADEIIVKYGMVDTYSKAVEVLIDDCGFLFQMA